jgi:hypothetical protein
MMEPGYLMLANSSLRWYQQGERQHKALGALGGRLLSDGNLTNEYLPSFRCGGCGGVFMTPGTSSGTYDRESIDKAR